ncbi:MAG: RNA 2',3'-cyclic phosphodiesterase [Acidobacteria bacterium]|nr:RNA 2',3'-cyclic phosphodiesterase [Acidobacteriota bacterium]MBI3426633.1 RNA 2',3'-cyclic phosphodiesterase [Acidobacteriota bacterium]
MRIFVAIELPAEIKTELGRAQTALRQTRAAVSWTKSENLHLTLRFLGEVETARLPALKRACAETAQQSAPFALGLDGLGFFPTAHKPKVIWAGLHDAAQALASLQQALQDRLAALGFPPEDKPFHPHLTFGRIKTPGGTKPLAECVAAYVLPPLPFAVTELVLLQSQLRAGGSLYTPLLRAPLG